MTFVQDPPVGQTALPRARMPTNQGSAVAPSPYAGVQGMALTPEQTAEADVYIAQLEEEGEYEKWKYMSARIPAHIQEYFLSTHPDPSAEPPPPEGDAQAQRGDQSALPGYQGAAYDPRVPAR